MQKDKRQHKRVSFRESVKTHKVLESRSGNVFEVEGTPMVVRSRNISEGGLCIELGSAVKPQMILKLNFQVDEKKEVDVYAKVVWTDESLTGLQFIVLDDTARKLIKQIIEATA